MNISNLLSIPRSSLPRDIAGGAAGSLALNIVYHLMLLGILVVLTRLLPVHEFGAYAIALSVVTLLALPFAGGMPVFVMRHVSAYVATKDYTHAKGFLVTVFLWVFVGSSLLITVLGLSLSVMRINIDPVFMVALPFIVQLSVLLFLGAILRGLKHVVLGRIPEFIIQPGLLLLILAIFLFTGGAHISAADVMGLHIGSIGISVLIAGIIVFFLLPKDIKSANAEYDRKTWIKSALPLVFAIGLIVLNTNVDVAMVGMLAGPEEAGYYRVASRMAAFIPFFLFAANNAMGPFITRLHVQKNTKELQRILTIVARLTFVLTLPVAGILLTFPELILSILFGSVFSVAAMALVILVIANVFSVMMGQVGQVMALTGHENLAALAVLISSGVNIALNLILIPLYGMEGAAVATGLSIIVWNGLLAYWTAQKTGLHCTALGPMCKRAAQ